MSKDMTTLIKPSELKNMLGYVSNNNRLEILSALLRYSFLGFTQLQEVTGMKSSSLDFHLEMLVNGEIVAKGKKDMPAYERRLKEAQVKELVTYIREQAKQKEKKK